MVEAVTARRTPRRHAGVNLALGKLAGFTLAQLGLRLWVRRRPFPIPYGWAWLLENPWRRRYRDPVRLADACALRPTDHVLEVGCGSAPPRWPGAAAT